MVDISLRPDLENEDGKGGGRRTRANLRHFGDLCLRGWSELRVRRRRVDNQPTSGYGEPTTQRGKLGFAFLNFGLSMLRLFLRFRFRNHRSRLGFFCSFVLQGFKESNWLLIAFFFFMVLISNHNPSLLPLRGISKKENVLVFGFGTSYRGESILRVDRVTR